MENEQKIAEIAEDLDKIKDEMTQLIEHINKLNANVEKLLSPFSQESNDTNRLANTILSYVDKRYGDGNN